MQILCRVKTNSCLQQDGKLKTEPGQMTWNTKLRRIEYDSPPRDFLAHHFSSENASCSFCDPSQRFCRKTQAQQHGSISLAEYSSFCMAAKGRHLPLGATWKNFCTSVSLTPHTAAGEGTPQVVPDTLALPGQRPKRSQCNRPGV